MPDRSSIDCSNTFPATAVLPVAKREPRPPLMLGRILTRMVGAVEGQGRFDYVTVKFVSDGQQRGLAKVEAQRHRERELLLRDRIRSGWQ